MSPLPGVAWRHLVFTGFYQGCLRMSETLHHLCGRVSTSQDQVLVISCWATRTTDILSPRYLPVCCSLCLFLFSPSWISSQMVPQPQWLAQKPAQLPGGFPQSWPHCKSGANWRCGKELQPVRPLQLGPAAGEASSASTWGWGGKEAGGMSFCFGSYFILSIFYSSTRKSEVHAEMIIVTKVKFLLNPGKNEALEDNASKS